MASDTLRDIDFSAADEPLRQDVRLLGRLVGEVIREQGGADLFERVEAARHAAIRRRETGAATTDAVRAPLDGLDAPAAGELVRAFSTYFQVVNLAERVHRIRRGGAHLIAGDEPQIGSLEHTMRRLTALGVDAPRIVALFCSSRVEPVFTAHPTEATRRAILDKQDRIARELIDRLDPARTPYEEEAALSRIRENVTAAWQTEEHPSARPTVADEREHVLHYVRTVLYQVVPALHERLESALRAVGADPPADPPALIRPGSWVGGDMDGNPNVDADTVRATLRRHRDLAVEAYRRDVAALTNHLTQSASRVAWSEDVEAGIDRYRAWFPEHASAIPARHADMGYRVFLELVGARLVATSEEAQHGYGGPDGLLADVDVVAASLSRHRGVHAGLFGVHRLQRRIRTFGFHMAALDVRQDARELRDVVARLLGDPAWPERPAAERAERLRALIAGPQGSSVGAGRIPASPAGLPDLATTERRVTRALEVFGAVGEGRARYGAEAIGSYIISMSEDVDDVLTVLLLARAAGLVEDGTVPLDVVPLFETVPDLERAEAVLDRLFTDAVVEPHLRARGGRQIVMVGYSDSNKDGGIASARWALQKALEGMARAADRHAVTLTVFHGRGGTVSRGGGLVHSAVATMPAESIGGRLRLTEQGEVIDAKYGLAPIALRNLERMLGSIVVRAAAPDEGSARPEWRAVAETIADAARGTYRALVYEDERFTPYFRAGTPIDVIERMAIGSRPASRREGAGVRDLRAIPWVFSWTQCRAMMTGWYGLGAGLEAARREHGADVLGEAAAEWPFLDTLLADVEMVLAKADLDIAALYAPLAPASARPVFGRIREEFDRTVVGVLELRGTSALLDSDPVLQRSIRLRNPYVDPMNLLQVDLLARWRASERADGALLDALLSTVNGIARGLQNTG